MENTLTLADSIQKLTLTGDEAIIAIDGRNIKIPLSSLKQYLGIQSFGAVIPAKIPSLNLGAPSDPKVYFGGAGTYTLNGNQQVLDDNLNMLFWDKVEWKVLGIPIDLAGYLSKDDIGKNNLFTTGQIINNQFIGTDGIKRTGQAGWQMIKIPVLPNAIYSIGDIRLTDVFNVAFYNASDVYIPGTVTPSNPSGSIVTVNSSSTGAFLYINIKRPVDAEDAYKNAGVYHGDVYHSGIDEILGKPLSAKFLTEGNSVPFPENKDSAINKGYLESNAVNNSDLTLTGENIFNTAEILNDVFISTDGLKRTVGAAGWKLAKIPVSSLTDYAIDDLFIEGGYNSAFYNSSDAYIPGTVKTTLSGEPAYMHGVLNSAFLYINIKRPADSDDVFSTMYVLEGTPEVAIEKIKGFSIVGYNGIKNPKEFSVQKVRKATFSFVFDDGLASDNVVADTLDSYGFKCGFALKAGTYVKSRYIALQDRGFEIISHSINHNRFDNTSSYTLAQAEAEIKESLDILTENGFKVKGWVTPYSVMKAEFIPLVKKYYEYGYTVGFGTVTPANENDSFHTFWNDTRELKRVSLESSSQADLLSAIDVIVSNGGHCVFYAHAYPDTLTVPKFEAVLTKLKSLSDAGNADVLTPIDGINKYFEARHSDLIELYSKSIIE